MTDDKVSDGEGTLEEEEQPEQDDFGALTGGDAEEDDGGNLPPLSTFESSPGTGFESDSSLPPLGSLDLDSGVMESSGSLPPIEGLTVEEPRPTGGAIKAPPPGFETAASSVETPSGGEFDTPPLESAETPESAEGSGFQDLSADSHFPEVASDIGPGPDSDVETPMFDSAFGADASGDGTPPPTQTMDTPMFGGPADTPASPAEGALAFDDGAFDMGIGDAFEAGGTPMPDFSPDTGLDSDVAPVPAAAPMSEEMPAPAADPTPPPAGRGGPGILVTVIVGVAAVVIGIIAGPRIVGSVALLNPMVNKLADADATIKDNEALIAKLTQDQGAQGEAGVTRRELDDRIAERNTLNDTIAGLESNRDQVQAELEQFRGDRGMIEEDIEAKNEEYIEAQEKYEELLNETSIVKARHLGLLAEVDRLTVRVGQLEEADARRLATKETLEHDIEQVAIVIREGIPLTPEKYSRSARLAAVEDLKAKAAAANWVTPALLEAYTELYLREFAIASTKTYFFANIPVTDKFGATHMKWAECLMVGNWGVYYRTLDGKNIGVYENLGSTDSPQYGFREDLPKNVQEEVARRIFDSRIEDYEAKVRVLAERQAIQEGDTALQRAFESL